MEFDNSESYCLINYAEGLSQGIEIFRVYILYKHIFNETVDTFVHIAVVLEFPCTQLIISEVIWLSM